MAKITGTTAGSNAVNDLLGLFRTWLTVTIASPWTEEEYTVGGTDTTVGTLSVRGPGAGADRRVFVNMRTENSGGHQGIEMNGATAYSSSLAFDQQQNVSPSVYFNLEKDTLIDYWFWANDRRFVIEAKVSTAYMSCHGGFFLPFATPEEYPFPLYIAASMGEIQEANFNNTRNRHIVDPGFGAAYYLRRGTQVWTRVSNHGEIASSGSADTDANRSVLTDAVMWPHGVPATWTDTFDDWSSQGKGFSRWRKSAQGESPVLQCAIIDPGAQVIPGALDGVFAAVGDGRTAESTSTNGGKTYIYFQNITRAGHRNVMAIEDI